MKRIQATPIYQAIVKDHGEEAFQNMDPDSGINIVLYIFRCYIVIRLELIE